MQKMIKTILVVSLCYGILVFFGENIQTLSTFPRVGYKQLELDNVQKIYLENENGEKISGIYLDNNALKTIFYCHGNGGNIDFFTEDIKYLSNLWYNLLTYDYPGYGESAGKPTESKVNEASTLFYNYLIQEKKQTAGDIIVFGYSIGAAVAIDLAYNQDISKLIVMSPFTSRYAMGQKMFGVPLQKLLFLENSFISIDKIKDITVPTLVIHGQKDTLIPFTMGEQIYEKAGSPVKHFIQIENIGHNYILSQYWSEIKPYLNSFLNNQELENIITIK